MDYFHQLKKLPHSFDVVIPFLKFNTELKKELSIQASQVFFENERLIICDKLLKKPVWAQDWWPSCDVHPFKTKSEALKILRSQKNLGTYYQSTENALAKSLKKDLRELSLKRIKYIVPSKFNFKYFSWTMLDNENLIICQNPDSQFPLGWHEFDEDKIMPPNRAYLKLWEILALNYIQLKKSDVAIELGSSPGGWSWVLSQNVKKVYSIDKAPLSPKIAKIENIIYQSSDAFKLNLNTYTDCNWLFSDIICTPERLFELVTEWNTRSAVKNFVCTIKFKGECDFNIIEKFLKIENSKIIHLYQNKNEVTWIKQELR